VIARVANEGVDVTPGLSGLMITSQQTHVSCVVSAQLDSMPESIIANRPSRRPDTQVLKRTEFSEWQWLLTPLKSGMMRLSFWVSPHLYVGMNPVGDKYYPPIERLVPVRPNFIYELGKFVKEWWFVIIALLTLIFIPGLTGLWKNRRRGPSPPFGFATS